MGEVVPINARMAEAFDRFCDATRRAQDSLDFADAMEAGRAWRAFLSTCISQEQRDWLDGQTSAGGLR